MGVRQERLADGVRDILGGLFVSGNIRDPRLQHVSITHVRLSGDLQIAYVYFRMLATEDPAPVLAGFEASRGFLRSAVAKGLRVRKAPELRFFYDESIEKGARIATLLGDIENESGS